MYYLIASVRIMSSLLCCNLSYHFPRIRLLSI